MTQQLEAFVKMLAGKFVESEKDSMELILIVKDLEKRIEKLEKQLAERKESQNVPHPL